MRTLDEILCGSKDEASDRQHSHPASWNLDDEVMMRQWHDGETFYLIYSRNLNANLLWTTPASMSIRKYSEAQ